MEWGLPHSRFLFSSRAAESVFAGIRDLQKHRRPGDLTDSQQDAWESVVGVPVCTCCGVLRRRLAVSGGKNPRTGQAGHLDWTQLELSHTPLCFRQHGRDLKEPLKMAVIPRTSMMVTQSHPEREVWAPLSLELSSSPEALRLSSRHALSHTVPSPALLGPVSLGDLPP